MTVTAPVTLRLQRRKALPFFSHHPWVYPGALQSEPADLPPGAMVAVRAADDQFIAWGLYNPHSKMRVRLYSWDEQRPLTDEFWAQRLDESLALRRQLFPEFTSELACRLVYSEADQLSGLIVDRYGDWLSLQFTSLAMAERQSLWLRLLQDRLQPRGVLLRTEKGIRAAEGLNLTDGLIAGEPPPSPLVIVENGVQFEVDLSTGQKTGFFLDQRDNRRRMAEFVRDRRVLDMFCYSAGFSLNALRAGASSVVAVDGSASALELAAANARRNGVDDRISFLHEDGFKALEQLAAAGERFDAVVLDPPKLCRHRDGLEAALRGYFSLNRLAVDLLSPGGLLMTCSCSGLVTHDDFVAVLSRVALDSRRHVQILEARGPSADHPASVHCLETDYLKCYLCRVT
jgi:23S rRNA (cytosine1962-C5)-methyltransferase